MDIIVASNNKGKIKEIKDIFVEHNVLSLNDISLNVDVEEDGNTFYENAFKKAKEIYDIVQRPVIADDSGLCIDCFDHWPGVLTHRFLGEDKNDQERNEFIIKKMKDNTQNRDCKFICCVVYYDGVNTLSYESVLLGTIAMSEKGENGFGFDKIFLLKNFKTIAQLSSKEKNKISPRKDSLENLSTQIFELIRTQNII
ncbi:MAG: RdgB/HAM1 family non-canonical purine NTP pyrophosphatase [Mycoplasmatota bacterium]